MEAVDVYTDGASRGNPGHSGIGIIMYDHNGQIIQEISEYIGMATNNVAEYKALEKAVSEINRMNLRKVRVFLDSELIVKQIKGEYKVKDEKLIHYYDKIMKSIKVFDFKIFHVKREHNKKADKLANEGIDRALKNKMIDK